MNDGNEFVRFKRIKNGLRVHISGRLRQRAADLVGPLLALFSEPEPPGRLLLSLEEVEITDPRALAWLNRLFGLGEGSPGEDLMVTTRPGRSPRGLDLTGNSRPAGTGVSSHHQPKTLGGKP